MAVNTTTHCPMVPVLELQGIDLLFNEQDCICHRSSCCCLDEDGQH